MDIDTSTTTTFPSSAHPQTPSIDMITDIIETPSKMKRKRNGMDDVGGGGGGGDDDENVGDDDGMNGLVEYSNGGENGNGRTVVVDDDEERVVKVSRTQPPTPTFPLPLSTKSSFYGPGPGSGNGSGSGSGFNSTTPISIFQSPIHSPFVTPGGGNGSGTGFMDGMNGLGNGSGNGNGNGHGHGHGLNGINGSGIGNGIARYEDSGMMMMVENGTDSDAFVVRDGDGNGNGNGNEMDVDMSSGNIGVQRGRELPDYFSHPISTYKSESPLAVQPFTTTLRPIEHKVGLLQPATPMEGDGRGFESPGLEKEGLRAVQEARNVHGAHCSTIPKLVLSEHPDPKTGERSMWSMCQSCGSCERVG